MMLIDTAPEDRFGIPSSARLEALGAALAGCETMGDLNALLKMSNVQSALRFQRDAAARLVSARYHELRAQAPGGPARSGQMDRE